MRVTEQKLQETKWEIIECQCVHKVVSSVGDSKV
jgi:hypothetical protein